MAATLALLGGADGITVHLREDRRHIQDRDVHILRETVPTGLNLEMACSDEILRIAIQTNLDAGAPPAFLPAPGVWAGAGGGSLRILAPRGRSPGGDRRARRDFTT